MIIAKFSKEMIKILKDMIGHIFCSYVCGNTIAGEAYGNLQINLDTFAVEVLNELYVLPFFNLTEDISHFSCKKKSLDELFKPYCIEPTETHFVSEKILSVSIIEDEISVNNGEYKINFDMALIVKTDTHKYIFSREWYFSENIIISCDKEFNDIYPISMVEESWSDDGENKVTINRTMKEL